MMKQSSLYIRSLFWVRSFEALTELSPNVPCMWRWCANLRKTPAWWYPISRFMFWTEWLRTSRQKARIGRAYMDGTNLTYIKEHELGWPNGLALDLSDHRLWWCDALFNRCVSFLKEQSHCVHSPRGAYLLTFLRFLLQDSNLSIWWIRFTDLQWSSYRSPIWSYRLPRFELQILLTSFLELSTLAYISPM